MVGFGFSVLVTASVELGSGVVVISTGLVVASSTSPGTSEVLGAGCLLVGSMGTGGVLASVVAASGAAVVVPSGGAVSA